MTKTKSNFPERLFVRFEEPDTDDEKGFFIADDEQGDLVEGDGPTLIAEYHRVEIVEATKKLEVKQQ